MKFCNIDFNIFNKEQLFNKDRDEVKCIATVNAQFIVLANTDQRYMNYINSNFATFDGEVPLKVARKKNSDFKRAEKLPGSEIVYDFCEYAKEKGMSVFFLGGKKSSNEEAVRRIKERYEIEIEGFSPDFENYPFSERFVTSCRDVIEKFRPDILFVGFGAPKQEWFIEDNLEFLNNIGVKYAIGSGGTFEFVSGQIKRAPVWLQKAGLEGLYRLFQEMNTMRLKRIIYSFKFLRYIGE